MEAFYSFLYHYVMTMENKSMLKAVPWIGDLP